MDLTTVFEAVIALLVAIITTVAVPYLQAKTSAETQAKIDDVIAVGVAAAEQLFETGEGEKKLEYVTEYLAGLNITVTVEQIEAAVYWLGEQ